VSTERAPNSKQCPVPGGPRPVPRDPEAYRSTNHYINRLKQRVPEDLQSDIAARCVKRGVLKAKTRAGEADGNAWQDFAFYRKIDDQPWCLIVAIVPQAYESEMVKHAAKTIYPLDQESDL